MKSLQENWFKISLIVTLIFCAILVFTFETKQQEIQKQSQLNSLIANCEKLASEKKNQILKENDGLNIGNIYEFRYNPIYNSCVLVYEGYFSQNSFLPDLLGHDIFEVINLSTGQKILSERVNPGDAYRKANESFNELRNKYIGSVTQ